MTSHLRLPQTGAARLGFGVSGPLASPIVPEATVTSLVTRAHALGVRLFDTGPSYGNGEGERRLGQAIARLPRAECVVATKTGIHAGRTRDFSPDAVARALDTSLQRLRMEYVDLLLLHGPAPHELTDGLLATLTGLRESGRVRMLGVAGRGAELEAAAASGEVCVVMAPVNAAQPAEHRDRLARLKAGGAQLIGIETMSGALPALPAPTGAGAAWRLAKGLARLAASRGQSLSPDSASSGTPSTTGAIQWSLGPGGADIVLTTTTRAARLDANAAAAADAPSTGA